jgi:hypothetical protein
MRLLKKTEEGREYLRPVPFQEEAMTIRLAPGVENDERSSRGRGSFKRRDKEGEISNVKYLM